MIIYINTYEDINIHHRDIFIINFNFITLVWQTNPTRPVPTLRKL